MAFYRNIYKKNFQSSYLLLLLLSIVLIYIKTFFNDFQQAWDDQNVILACPFLGDWSKLTDMFTKPYASQFSPINTFFLNIIYMVFGFKPMAFHAFSLILHCINTILIIKVAKLILQKTGYGETQAHTYAMIVTIIFALHPMQVEAVAWVSASKIPLYTLFTLCGLFGYEQYLINRKFTCYFQVIVCMILACGSKEQAVAFPFLLLLWDWLNDRKLLNLELWLEKLPFVIIALGFGFVTMQLQTGVKWVLPYSYFDRILFVCISFVEYIYKAIVPVNLNYFYPFPMKPGHQLPLSLWMYPFVFGIIIWWFYDAISNGRKLICFGLLFFAINLLLALHIIPLSRKFIIADRYIYLSIVGLVLVGIDLWHHFVMIHKSWGKVGIFILYLLLCYYGSYSFVRVGDWRDSITLKKNVKKEVKNISIINQTLKLNIQPVKR